MNSSSDDTDFKEAIENYRAEMEAWIIDIVVKTSMFNTIERLGLCNESHYHELTLWIEE